MGETGGVVRAKRALTAPREGVKVLFPSKFPGIPFADNPGTDFRTSRGQTSNFNPIVDLDVIGVHSRFIKATTETAQAEQILTEIAWFATLKQVWFVRRYG